MGPPSTFWLLCCGLIVILVYQTAGQRSGGTGTAGKSDGNAGAPNVRSNPQMARALLLMEKVLVALIYEEIGLRQAGYMGQVSGQGSSPYDALDFIDSSGGGKGGGGGRGGDGGRGGGRRDPPKQPKRYGDRYMSEYDDEDFDGDEALWEHSDYNDVELPKQKACKEVECPIFNCAATDPDTQATLSKIPAVPASEYRTAGGKEYFFSTYETTFDQAGLACCKENMSLVSIESGEEYAVLLELYKKEKKGSLFWSSGQYLQCPNSYRWCGSMQRFQGMAVWKNGDIDAPGECVAFQYMDGGSALSFVDTICENKMKFICERETKNETKFREEEIRRFQPKCTRPTCPELPCAANPKLPAPKTDLICGKKYKLVNETANFPRAAMACCEMGMRLLSLETREEQLCVENFYKDQIKNNDHVWTSGVDLGCEGRYAWCGSGSSMKNTDMMVWMEGEPNNYNEDEDCLAMWAYNGKFKLNDEICTEMYAYVCEEIETNSALLNKGGPDLFKRVTTRPAKTEAPDFLEGIGL